MRRTSSNTRIPDKLIERSCASSALQSIQQVKSFVKDRNCARRLNRFRADPHHSLDNRAYRWVMLSHLSMWDSIPRCGTNTNEPA